MLQFWCKKFGSRFSCRCIWWCSDQSSFRSNIIVSEDCKIMSHTTATVVYFVSWFLLMWTCDICNEWWWYCSRDDIDIESLRLSWCEITQLLLSLSSEAGHDLYHGTDIVTRHAVTGQNSLTRAWHKCDTVTDDNVSPEYYHTICNNITPKHEQLVFVIWCKN